MNLLQKIGLFLVLSSSIGISLLYWSISQDKGPEIRDPNLVIYTSTNHET